MKKSILLIMLMFSWGLNKLWSEYHVLSWEAEPLVVTPYGQVLGYPDKDNTWVWRGIPYAQPPVGELRWKAPLEPIPWKGVLKAKRFKESGPQFDFVFKGKIKGTEDNLYLNIWRPQSDKKDLPVYVYIHGGGNSIGSAHMAKENYGHALAHRKDVVFVSMNYRLGPLGWLYHPKLQTEGTSLDKSGNYGTMDLIQALTWIQDNIRAFGGDPDNVIITGESAGAANVLSLLISPRTEGLFHKAMSQSGYPKTFSLKEAAEFTDWLVLQLMIKDGLGADTNLLYQAVQNMSEQDYREYLYKQPAKRLISVLSSAMVGMVAMPLIIRDGQVIPTQGYEVLDKGLYQKKVPIILGSNKDENRLFLFFGKMFKKDKDLYGQVGDYSSDLWKASGVDDLAARFTGAGSPVWAYHFHWGTQDDNGFSVLPKDWGHKLGAFHSIDISFFTGTDTIFSGLFSQFLFTRKNKAGRLKLSQSMMDYVSSFHLYGDPSVSNSTLSPWIKWSNEKGSPRTMILDAGYEDVDLHMITNVYAGKQILSEMQENLPEEALKEIENFIMEQ